MRVLFVYASLVGVIVSTVSGRALISKCCPVGQSIKPLKGCIPTNLTFVPEFSDKTPEAINITVGFSCNYGSYRLEPSGNNVDEFHLLSNGSLHLPFHDETELSPKKYCLESFLEPDGTIKVLPLLCFPPISPKHPWNNFGIKLYRIGCMVSIPFLLMTTATYLLIDELRTLHGKIIICYSSCLAVAYACLSYVQFEGEELAHNACISVAFLMQFFFVASFFWLNVLCFHTWRAMTRTIAFVEKNSNYKKRFLWYSVYAWGCTFIILAISLIMDLSPGIPSSYIVKPNVGLDSCWFQNNTAKLVYFYGPISILLVANALFFLLTIWYLQVNYKKRPLNTMRDFEAQVMMNKRKQIFVEYLLLFCAMGLNWVLEVISWVMTTPNNDGPRFWTFIDTFNTLYGIIVFLVFVAQNQTVRKLALDKFCFQSKYNVVDNHTP